MADVHADSTLSGLIRNSDGTSGALRASRRSTVASDRSQHGRMHGGHTTLLSKADA